MEGRVMQTEFEYKGVKCKIVLNTFGVIKEKSPELKELEEGFNYITQTDWFCGYVRVPEGLEFDSLDLLVHGGVTYDQKEDDGFRWIGFDCIHFGDNMLKCNFPFVEKEVVSLADQILELVNKKEVN